MSIACIQKCFLQLTWPQTVTSLLEIGYYFLKGQVLEHQLMISWHMNFHSLLGVTNFITIIIVTMVQKCSWKMLWFHMISHHTPPRMAELSTYSTHPLAGSWGLATIVQQVWRGLQVWRFTYFRNNQGEFSRMNSIAPQNENYSKKGSSTPKTLYLL